MNSKKLHRKETLRRDLSKYLALCVLMIFFGCKKEDPIGPSVVDPLTVSSVTLNGKTFTENMIDTMKVGTSFHLKWNSNADTLLLIIGSETFKKTGSGNFVSMPIAANTDISLTFIKKGNENLKKTASIIAKHADIIDMVKPKVTITVTPDRTDSGNTVTVIILVEGDYTFVSSPEISDVNKPGQYQRSVNQTTTFHVFAGNSVGTDEDSTKVTVVPPPPSNYNDTIHSHPWSETSAVSSCSGDEGGYWTPTTVQQKDLDTKTVFNSNGTFDSYRYGVHTNWGNYTINGDTIDWGGGVYRIMVMNSASMMLKLLCPSFGCPGNLGYIKMTFGPAVLNLKK